jgi:hypothetical protein
MDDVPWKLPQLFYFSASYKLQKVPSPRDVYPTTLALYEVHSLVSKVSVILAALIFISAALRFHNATQNHFIWSILVYGTFSWVIKW